jgi:hypothetical protein
MYHSNDGGPDGRPSTFFIIGMCFLFIALLALFIFGDVQMTKMHNEELSKMHPVYQLELCETGVKKKVCLFVEEH